GVHAGVQPLQQLAAAVRVEREYLGEVNVVVDEAGQQECRAVVDDHGLLSARGQGVLGAAVGDHAVLHDQGALRNLDQRRSRLGDRRATRDVINVAQVDLGGGHNAPLRYLLSDGFISAVRLRRDDVAQPSRSSATTPHAAYSQPIGAWEL